VAGNVKEWCRNLANGQDRYILGGAWDDPPYMFADPDVQSPLGRKSNFGGRLVRYVTEPPPKEVMAAVPYAFRDYAKRKTSF
jgi:hypothetical protein